MRCPLPTRILFATLLVSIASASSRPNIVLVMADDQGWGQVGYNGHPYLKTPNLDAMAAAGLRLDRFYAAGPVCSPTRASVLTGRTPNRVGVPGHGYNLALQEKTLPRALQQAGYATGHFGKWHLNGVRGAGVPVLKDDANHPGRYGFDTWISTTNYFDLNPLMSHQGEFKSMPGESSEVIVDEALKFIEAKSGTDTPFLAVIWFGSPHNPMLALPGDRPHLPDEKLSHHLGEIVAMDRSIGALRQGLRDLQIHENTLIWYCSDNGGLDLDPDACANLRGHKSDLFEGGIRVPGVVEWPGTIEHRIIDTPSSTMDIMPTLVDLLELPPESLMEVHDGESLVPLFKGSTAPRTRPIPFIFQRSVALIDGEYKLLSLKIGDEDAWTLYNLRNDPGESRDLSRIQPDKFNELRSQVADLLASVNASANGLDYAEGRIVQPSRREFWYQMSAYAPHFELFLQRPEYKGYRKRIEP